MLVLPAFNNWLNMTECCVVTNDGGPSSGPFIISPLYNEVARTATWWLQIWCRYHTTLSFTVMSNEHYRHANTTNARIIALFTWQRSWERFSNGIDNSTAGQTPHADDRPPTQDQKYFVSIYLTHFWWVLFCLLEGQLKTFWVDFCEIWGIGRLFTREECIKSWKWSGTYSGHCGYHKFTKWATDNMHKCSRCYKFSREAAAFSCFLTVSNTSPVHWCIDETVDFSVAWRRCRVFAVSTVF